MFERETENAVCEMTKKIIGLTVVARSSRNTSRCAGRVLSILLEIHEVSGNTCSAARAHRTLDSLREAT